MSKLTQQPGPKVHQIIKRHELS